MTGEDNDAVQMDNSWSQDGDLPGCAQLDRRWVLWHEFMKEHAQLDGWLQSTEQVARASAPNSALVTYATGKEELAQFERLSRESACRLVQLDNLTSRNRALTHMFDGAMRERLLTLARDCGRRWDCLNARLDTVARRLKHFVSEWEEYETEREELSVLLSDLDRRLMEVEHLTGNSCDKMRKLQMFQMSVCANSARVNALLERGEALIQRSEPTDAQDVERQLQDLLLLCSGVFHRIGRVHTRLLSMRLVFEDDTILSPDSGCPSEALLEDEGALDIAALDRPASTNLDLSRSGNSTPDPLPPHLSSSSPGPDLPSAPPSPCLLTHDHLGLEWDPSVDIGRSMSREDADSSYFSAYTGLSSCREQRSASRSSLKRRSYLSSLGSQEAIPSSGQPAQVDGDGSEPTTEAGVVTQEGGTLSTRVQWAASTPDEQVCEPISFDRGRVRAWLGDQSFIASDRRRFHSAGVQTDWLAQAGVVTQEGGTLSTRVQWAASTPDEQACQPISFDRGRVRAWLGDQSPIPSDRRRFHFEGVQTNWLAQSEEHPGLEEVKVPELPKQQLRISKGSIPPWWPRPPVLIYLLLGAALALALLACPLWALLQPDCHRANRLPPSFHWTLRYVNGPPPT